MTKRVKEEKSDDEEVEVMDDDQPDFFGPSLDSSQGMKDFASMLTMTQAPALITKALVHVILEASTNAGLKKCEQASPWDEQKAKSFTSPSWFQKEEKEKKPADEEGAAEDSSCLERDWLVQLDNNAETMLHVLDIWQKHCNKRHLSAESRKKWSKPFAAGTCNLSLRMVEHDRAFQQC